MVTIAQNRTNSRTIGTATYMIFTATQVSVSKQNLQLWTVYWTLILLFLIYAFLVSYLNMYPLQRCLEKMLESENTTPKVTEV